MNIFAVDYDPVRAAQMLPDKHVVKMPLETAQMLSIVCSDWYRGWGSLPKKDGSVYATERGAFRNHPCTQWAAESDTNLAWLLRHGVGLCDEYYYRYGKTHSCFTAIQQAAIYFFEHDAMRNTLVIPPKFARAMPDDLKNDVALDDVTAYRRYLNTKVWAFDNYKRIPERRPNWLRRTNG